MPDNRGTSLVYWPHTNMNTPLATEVRDISATDIGRGVAYSGKLVHPERGEVGLIANRGVGGPTMFYPYTATFDRSDLENLASQSFQDGVPLRENQTGDPVENLLDEMIYEAECAREVDRMRNTGEFLVRTFDPASDLDGCPFRGAPVPLSRVVTDYPTRVRLAEQLDNDESLRRRSAEEIWQMFDGQTWVPLLSEPQYTEREAAERLNTIRAHASETTLSFADKCGPLPDGFYVTGNHRTPGGRFVLLDNAETPGWRLAPSSWCTCRARRKLARFERWTTDAGLIGSGVIHSAKHCLRLVRIA